MYVKLERTMSERDDFVLTGRGSKVVPKEVCVFPVKKVRFTKYFVDLSECSFSDKVQEMHDKHDYVHILWGYPKEKDAKFEFLVVEVEHLDGSCPSYVAPESSLYVLDDSGKTIDLYACIDRIALDK